MDARANPPSGEPIPRMVQEQPIATLSNCRCKVGHFSDVAVGAYTYANAPARTRSRPDVSPISRAETKILHRHVGRHTAGSVPLLTDRASVI